MYPPPPSEIIQRFARASLDTVCFGKFTVHLTFEDGNRISFGAPFKFARIDELSSAPANEFPLVDSQLMRTIGSEVTEAMCETDGTLALTFATQDVLVIYANDPMYEAYTLLVEGREFVV